MGIRHGRNAAIGRPEREGNAAVRPSFMLLRLAKRCGTSVLQPELRKVGAGGNAGPHYVCAPGISSFGGGTGRRTLRTFRLGRDVGGLTR